MLFVANYFFRGLQLQLVLHVRANIYLIHLFVLIYKFVTSLKKGFTAIEMNECEKRGKEGRHTHNQAQINV
jgi:hypothetical protein